MTQTQLDRAVSAATGESRRTVRSLGFSLADPVEVEFDPEPASVGRFLDWDDVAAQRHAELAIY